MFYFIRFKPNHIIRSEKYIFIYKNLLIILKSTAMTFISKCNDYEWKTPTVIIFGCKVHIYFEMLYTLANGTTSLIKLEKDFLGSIILQCVDSKFLLSVAESALIKRQNNIKFHIFEDWLFFFLSKIILHRFLETSRKAFCL